MTRAWDKEKIWVPDRNRTPDLSSLFMYHVFVVVIVFNILIH